METDVAYFPVKPKIMLVYYENAFFSRNSVLTLNMYRAKSSIDLFPKIYMKKQIIMAEKPLSHALIYYHEKVL